MRITMASGLLWILEGTYSSFECATSAHLPSDLNCSFQEDLGQEKKVQDSVQIALPLDITEQSSGTGNVCGR